MKQTIKVADKPTADEIKQTVESNAEKLDGIVQELESGGMLSDPNLGLAALKQSLDELKNYVGNGKRDVASAITRKGVPTATDAGFATLINNIDKIVTLMQGTQDANAAAQQILNGYSAYAKGAKVDGSMANRGAVSQSLGINGSYTIPAGYHNGNGKVTQSIATQGAQTITPGTAAKTIAANQYLSGVQTIAGDANLVAANIAKGKSIFGVNGNFEGNANIYIKELPFIDPYNLDRHSVALPFAPQFAFVIAYGQTAIGKKLDKVETPQAITYAAQMHGVSIGNTGSTPSGYHLMYSYSAEIYLYVKPAISNNIINIVRLSGYNSDISTLYKFSGNLPGDAVTSTCTQVYLVAFKVF